MLWVKTLTEGNVTGENLSMYRYVLTNSAPSMVKFFLLLSIILADLSDKEKFISNYSKGHIYQLRLIQISVKFVCFCFSRFVGCHGHNYDCMTGVKIIVI